MLGGDGNDTLVGCEGADTLTGGAGQDLFVYENVYDFGDTITDFQTGASGDFIYLLNLYSDSAFTPTTTLSSLVRLVQSGTSTILQVDRDGSAGVYSFESVAILLNVTATDILPSQFIGIGIGSDTINIAPSGAVTISGIATQGQILAAGNTLADADGLGTISYQWKADDRAITNATSSAYTLTKSEVGKAITVTANYTDENGTPESVTSSSLPSVANVNYSPTGTVSITGTTTQGQTLTAQNTLADADGIGTISYQWQSAGADISGALSTTYTLTVFDVDKAITVLASYTDGYGTHESISSGATALISTADTSAPTVTTFSPAYAATGVDVGSDIEMTFSEAIQKGTGIIAMHTGSATGTVVESYNAATSWNIGISGNTLTINPTSNLTSNTHYYVTFDAGIIKDLSSNSYTGTTTYDFTTADTSAPTVTTFSPAYAATGVDVGSDIEMTFSEAIQKGTGTIAMHTGSATGTVVGSYSTTYSGSTVTINPTADLASGTHYYVTIETGAVKDLAGNSVIGTTGYNFTTTATADYPLMTPIVHNNASVMPERYSGPATAAGGEIIHFQFIGDSSGEVLIGTGNNDFISVGAGVDAVNSGAGNDVVDGGLDSNFLTGGVGTDIFFSDGRGGGITWSTITDWQAGEQLSVWGWKPGTSQIIEWRQDGAEGYKGITMHADLDGNGVIDTSVTFTGITSQSQLPTPHEFADPALLWFM